VCDKEPGVLDGRKAGLSFRPSPQPRHWKEEGRQDVGPWKLKGQAGMLPYEKAS